MQVDYCYATAKEEVLYVYIDACVRRMGLRHMHYKFVHFPIGICLSKMQNPPHSMLIVMNLNTRRNSLNIFSSIFDYNFFFFIINLNIRKKIESFFFSKLASRNQNSSCDQKYIEGFLV